MLPLLVASEQRSPAVRWLDVCLLVLLAALVFLLVAITANGMAPGDLGVWLSDSLGLARCLSGYTQACGAISKFPLAYTFNSGLLVEGMRHAIKLPAYLAALNALALALPLLLLRFCRSSRDLFQSWGFYVLLWLLTPIPRFYLFTGSLEVQAGAIIGLAFVLSFRALQVRDGGGMGVPMPSFRAIGLCNGLWFTACLYKDTSFITFPLVGLLLFIADQARRSLTRQASLLRTHGAGSKGKAAKALARPPLLAKQEVRMLWLTMPALIAAALTEVSFNWIRYGSLLPVAYLDEARLTTTPTSFRLQSLFWSLASPNGGLVVFWGLCFAVLGLYWLRKRRQVSALLRSQFAAVRAATLWALISLLGLSLWWNPFGWASWGNRLMVPAMMAIVIGLWDAVFNGGWLQPISPQAAAWEDASGSQPEPARRKSRPKPALLANYLLVVVLGFSSLPYVLLGYQGNGVEVRRYANPQLVHCRKMLVAVNTIPLEKHLELIYSGELWWQCAMESYGHNPVLARSSYQERR